jgi:Cu2+-exporting ATPase
MKIKHLYTAIFIIAMSDMIPNNPLMQVMDHLQWNWKFALSLPVVLCSLDVLFELGNLLLVGI